MWIICNNLLVLILVVVTFIHDKKKRQPSKWIKLNRCFAIILFSEGSLQFFWYYTTIITDHRIPSTKYKIFFLHQYLYVSWYAYDFFVPYSMQQLLLIMTPVSKFFLKYNEMIFCMFTINNAITGLFFKEWN